MEKLTVTPASGNIYLDLGFPREEAENLHIRSQLMLEIERHYRKSKLTQTKAAQLFGITQPRLNLLLKGRIDEFSIDALINMLARSGKRVDIRIKPTRKAA